jgi:hypothetical protein
MKSNGHRVANLMLKVVCRLRLIWGRSLCATSMALLIYVAMSALALSGQFPNAAQNSTRDFYISPDGSDVNPGTEEAPFSSFKKADSVVQAGDTVHVQPGTYSGYTALNTIRIATSGSESARIKWIAQTKWTAQIVGHVNPDNGLGWGIVISGDYVDLVGFDVTSDANMGVWVLGTHVRVIGNHVHDIPGQRGCTSYGASGIEQGNYSGGYMEAIANVVHNVGAGGPGSCNKYHGIYLAAPFDTAVNNISYHNASKGIGTWHAANHNTISNNTVFDNDVGILVGAGDTPCFSTCSADYVVVSNNIMYHNKTNGFWQYSKAGQHNTYTNNLVFANGVRNVLLRGNCGNASVVTCNSFDKAVFANPQFVNPTGSFFTGDYHLKGTSPALKAGTVVGAPPTDFDGRSRLEALAPDLGAYESGEQLAKNTN